VIDKLKPKKWSEWSFIPFRDFYYG